MLPYVAVLTDFLRPAPLRRVRQIPRMRRMPSRRPPIRARLAQLLPAGSKLEDLRPSPIAGIYEYSQGAEISYLTADGKYFIDGNLYDMKSRDNLTETLRTHCTRRIDQFGSGIGDADFLAGRTEIHDHCFYGCRLRVIAETAHQIRNSTARHPRPVHVLSAHRTRNESWKKAEIVWCSPNRNEALTRARPAPRWT